MTKIKNPSSGLSYLVFELSLDWDINSQYDVYLYCSLIYEVKIKLA